MLALMTSAYFSAIAAIVGVVIGALTAGVWQRAREGLLLWLLGLEGHIVMQRLLGRFLKLRAREWRDHLMIEVEQRRTLEDPDKVVALLKAARRAQDRRV